MSQKRYNPKKPFKYESNVVRMFADIEVPLTWSRMFIGPNGKWLQNFAENNPKLSFKIIQDDDPEQFIKFRLFAKKKHILKQGLIKFENRLYHMNKIIFNIRNTQSKNEIAQLCSKITNKAN